MTEREAFEAAMRPFMSIQRDWDGNYEGATNVAFIAFCAGLRTGRRGEMVNAESKAAGSSPAVAPPARPGRKRRIVEGL